MSKGLIAGFGTFVAMMLIAWYGGVNFGERGFGQAYWLFVSLLLGGGVGFLVATAPKGN